MEYLKNLTDKMINEHGLCKVLYVRKESIHMKHVLKRFFVSGNPTILEWATGEILERLNMSLFQYIAYITDKMRFVNKISRDIQLEHPSELIGMTWRNAPTAIKVYDPLHPIMLIDFDKVVTNEYFRKNYFQYMMATYKTVIVTANPSTDILAYIKKNYSDYKGKVEIIQRKGMDQKIIALKEFAIKNVKYPIFYFDDEDYYLDHGLFLFMHPYKVKKNKVIKFGGKK